MRCSNCGKCCEKTEMELSSKDIKRLEETGYRREEFVIIDGAISTVSLMRNAVSIGREPLGCYLYPVVYLVNEGAVVDDLCPMKHTISEQELRTKAKILDKLLKKKANSRCYTRKEA